MDITVLRTMLCAKLHRVTVTQADLDYVGSVTIDRALLEPGRLLLGERVVVVDVTNGNRLTTYVVEGEAGTGLVCINSAAAHPVQPGDIAIVIAETQMDEVEAGMFSPRVVFVDQGNLIVEVSSDPGVVPDGSGSRHPGRLEGGRESTVIQPGPTNSLIDVAGIRVGHAEAPGGCPGPRWSSLPTVVPLPAVAGGLKGVVGSASVVLADVTTVAVLAVVNSSGSCVDPLTGEVYAARFGLPGEFTALRLPDADEVAAARAAADAVAVPDRPRPAFATTIGVVAPDAILTKAQCAKVSGIAHDGMGTCHPSGPHHVRRRHRLHVGYG